MGKNFLLLAVAAAIAVAAYTAISNTPHIPEGSARQKAAAVLDESGCALCHSTEAPLPFYAKIPLVNIPIKSDISAARAKFDITSAMQALKSGNRVLEDALEKIKLAVGSGNMPPLGFKLVHWKSNITAAERDAVNLWIAEARKADAANPNAAQK